MEITNIQKYTHTSPRKMRLVVDMIKKMHPVAAMTTLHFTSKSAAGDLKKIISTAVGNAKQGGLNVNGLYFKSIEVNEGPTMKRFRPGSKGRALPYQRRMSHVKIVLSDEVKQSSVLSGRLSDKSQSVISLSETEEQKTEKPKSENRKLKTDNRKNKEKS